MLSKMEDIKNKKRIAEEKLKRFVPHGFEGMLADLLFKNIVHFKIVNPRATKLGDFRPGNENRIAQITVNGDLNPYSFLITSIHEFAHLETYLIHGRTVKPHGEEWKSAFRKLLLPVIDSKLLPNDIVNALVNSLVNTKASSCSDVQLFRVLKKYDKNPHGLELLETLPKNSIFGLQGKKYIKGDLRRKRYLCKEVTSQKIYLVSGLAEVNPLKENE
jgi:SprT protein